MILGNFYANKHYRFYIIIPVALLLISLYFIPKIQLDSTLKGGVSVQVQTNSTINTRTLTALVDSNISDAQATVSRSPGGLSITMAANSSLSDAETNLLAFYSAYDNYTQLTLNITEYESDLSTQSTNVTLQGLLSTSKQQQQKSLSDAQSYLSAELVNLEPFIGSPSNADVTNSSASITAWPNIAKNSYSNASLIYQNNVITKLKGVLPFTSYSYNEVTPTLGAFFLKQMINIIIIAFILVAIVVFAVFRTPVPAFAVVFGAVNDLIVALGAMGLFGIPLGVASIGGLLMLIGFSIDTDILAAIRIIKRTGDTAAERAFASFKTGTTMTITALISFSVLLAVAYFAFIPTYLEIAGVVMVGLLADVITTWLADVPMVLWYKQRKEARGK
jgi:preprotein translocase subunit SecF